MSHHQKETNSYNQIYRMKIRVMPRMKGIKNVMTTGMDVGGCKEVYWV